MTSTSDDIDLVDLHTHYRPPWWDVAGGNARRLFGLPAPEVLAGVVRHG
ncbi:hypothetical protein V6U90_08350 [Micromonospora sp. CPCC 206060]